MLRWRADAVESRFDKGGPSLVLLLRDAAEEIERHHLAAKELELLVKAWKAPDLSPVLPLPGLGPAWWRRFVGW